jgi:glycosyltransferase involved in cell wall biosynthesis
MGSRADFFSRMASRKIHDVQIISTTAMLIEGYDVNFCRKAIYRLVDCYSSKFVSHFIAVSKALKIKLILERKIPKDKISVIYNGVELDKYNPERNGPSGLRRSLGIDDGCIVVGTIGRLVHQKGFQYFIEAAEILYSKNNKVRFIIVGDGPEENNLKTIVQTHGISKVFMFTGQRFDIPQILAMYDIFVLPSVLEGLPRVVIEAMAMAKPIVATDISGVREQLIHNRTGLIVPAKNPEALSKAITQLLNNKIRGHQLGNEARKSAEEKFDLNQTVYNIERLYERLSARL